MFILRKLDTSPKGHSEMSPQKRRRKTAEWEYLSLKKEGRKVLKGPYSYPNCTANNLRIQNDRQEQEVCGVCISCGINVPLDFSPHLEPVDYYNMLMDKARE